MRAAGRTCNSCCLASGGGCWHLSRLLRGGCTHAHTHRAPSPVQTPLPCCHLPASAGEPGRLRAGAPAGPAAAAAGQAAAGSSGSGHRPPAHRDSSSTTWQYGTRKAVSDSVCWVADASAGAARPAASRTNLLRLQGACGRRAAHSIFTHTYTYTHTEIQSSRHPPQCVGTLISRNPASVMVPTNRKKRLLSEDSSIL